MRHHRALGDHHDAITQRRDLLHDVAGEDHAAAFVAQLPQETAHGARGHHVQAVGGFVQDDVARVMHDGARDGGLGALALREAFGLAVEDVFHFQRLRQGLHALCDGSFAHAMQAAEIGDVLTRRQALVHATRIGQHAEAAADIIGMLCHVQTIHLHRALIGRHQGVEHAQGGGFAGAIGAEQAGDFSVARDEADIRYRLNLAGSRRERFGQM